MAKERKVPLSVQIPAELDRRLEVVLHWKEADPSFTKNDLVTRALTREIALMEIENGAPFPTPQTLQSANEQGESG